VGQAACLPLIRHAPGTAADYRTVRILPATGRILPATGRRAARPEPEAAASLPPRSDLYTATQSHRIYLYY
jgi:hypothetical protein